MKKTNIVRFTLALAVVAVGALLVSSQSKLSAETQSRESGPTNTVEGVWAVTRHGVNGQTGQILSTFPALMTFHQDGTVSGQSHGPFPTNAYGPAEHGVWEHGRGNTFSFRLLSYSYTDAGGFSGSTVVTGTGKTTNSDNFTYEATIQVYDVNGNLLATRSGKATATRFE